MTFEFWRAKGVRVHRSYQCYIDIKVTPLHLAAVLFKDPASLGVQLVQKAAVSGQNLSLDELQAALDKALRKLPRQDPPPSDIRPNGKFFAVLRKAQQLQKAQKDSHAAVDHILVALYEDADAGAVLSAAGLTRRKLEDAVRQVRGSRKITSVGNRKTRGGKQNAKDGVGEDGNGAGEWSATNERGGLTGWLIRPSACLFFFFSFLVFCFSLPSNSAAER